MRKKLAYKVGKIDILALALAALVVLWIGHLIFTAEKPLKGTYRMEGTDGPINPIYLSFVTDGTAGRYSTRTGQELGTYTVVETKEGTVIRLQLEDTHRYVAVYNGRDTVTLVPEGTGSASTYRRIDSVPTFFSVPDDEIPAQEISAHG